MNPPVDIHPLNFSYGSVPTLSGIDLQDAEVEFLVLVLLTLPAAVAGYYIHSLGRMMLIATMLGALLSVTGLALSYGPDLPAGPTIILLVGGVYVLSAMLTQFLELHRARLAAAQGERQGATGE